MAGWTNRRALPPTSLNFALSKFVTKILLLKNVRSECKWWAEKLLFGGNLWTKLKL